MIIRRKWLLSAAALGLAATTNVPAAPDSRAPEEPRATPASSHQCTAVLEGIRRMQTVTGEAIATVRAQLREARERAEWLGPERFAPYMAELREQERQLQATLRTAQEMTCTAAPELSGPAPR